MNDPRQTPFNTRAAHVSLKGVVNHENFTAGQAMSVVQTRTAISARPFGPTERQLIFGETFQVLDVAEGAAYGFAQSSGYCGYVDHADLGPPLTPTHRVRAARSYALATPDLKTGVFAFDLSLGTLVAVAATDGPWAQIGADAWVPLQHLARAERFEPDPVAVAERLLGTPYLWGGNSAFGIDCSGLVQLAARMSGIDCPSDSDQQAHHFGKPTPAGDPAARGDLYFWQGHVAIAVDDTTLIHANAHDMAVAYEPIAAAIARIRSQGEGPVTARGKLA